MAIQQDFLENKDPNQGSQSTLSQDNSSIGAGAGSASSGGEGSRGTGSGFTNLSQYLTANQEKSGEMAGQVLNPIEQSINSASSKFSDLQNNAKSALDAGTVRDSGLISQFKNSPGSSVDQKAFARQTGGYTGPQSAQELVGYQDLSQLQASNDQKIKGIQSLSGIEQGLRDVYGKNTPYTSGQSKLDAYIAGSGTGKNVLNAATSKYDASNPKASLQAFADKTNADIAGAKASSSRVAEDTMNAKSAADKANAERKAKKLADDEAARKARMQSTMAKKVVAAPAPATLPLAEAPKPAPVSTVGSIYANTNSEAPSDYRRRAALGQSILSSYL